MKRGFTILELLVASLILGILVTILTMIFNQSSIAWRTGIAGVSDLGDARYTMGTVREVADNAFAYGGKGYRTLGLWDESGQLRKRAVDADDEASDNQLTSWFFNLPQALSVSGMMTPRQFQPKSVGSGSSSGSLRNYTVNVKSDGPDGKPSTWDDIWSFPDDPNEW